ncbi:MAG TPA: hypothetical protein VFL13_15345 [Candidatus Baltobacteraceae bacterium]|nr:hypothetical protein [Candidatus Baltobacteraceae bacterium]
MYDRLIAAAGYWTVLGLFYDLSWHIRHHVDTFFTAQHAILYSGLAALAVIAFFFRREPDFRTTAAGLALFAVGGAADLIEHQFLGIEHDFDALVSPTHLAIGFGLMIVVAAPLRQKRDRGACVAAAAAFVELLHFITHPFFRLNDAARFNVAIPHQLTSDAVTLQTLRAYEQGGGLLGAILLALLTAVPLAYLAQRDLLRRGSCTAFCVLATVLIAYSHSASASEFFAVMIAAVAAGISGDLFLRPHPSNRDLVLVACVPAFVICAVQVLLTAVTQGLWWDVSFACGTVVLATAFALFGVLPLLSRRATEPGT